MEYKIVITFNTDKELTKDELADIETAISLQLEEPTDYDQNDVEFSTSDINYQLERVN